MSNTMAKRKRRTFTKGQKADAVQLAKEMGNVSQAARDLDISYTVLRSWIKQAEIDKGDGPDGALSTEEREELRRLRKEIRVLQMERDFLKKATAFFAKETDQRSS